MGTRRPRSGPGGCKRGRPRGDRAAPTRPVARRTHRRERHLLHGRGPDQGGQRGLQDFVPDYDAASLAMLKRAGALMLGKAVTTEFACLDPSPTFNPWNSAPHAGRQQQRISRGGGIPHVSRPRWVRRRWVPCCAPAAYKRRGRIQAHVWPGKSLRRRARELEPGHGGLARTVGGGCRALAAGDRGPRCV